MGFIYPIGAIYFTQVTSLNIGILFEKNKNG
jgi:hypothetical protein